MKTLLFTLALLFAVLSSFAQEHVKILKTQIDGGTKIYAKNLSENEVNLSITFELVNANMDKQQPVEASIPANDSILVTTIQQTNKNEKWSYKIQYSYTIKTPKLATTDILEHPSIQAATIIDTNTLVVFTKNGCGRCNLTINHLNSNNIKYTEYNTSNDANNLALWKTLEAAGFEGNTIKMPVIISNNETFYNIKDLVGFLKTL